MKSLLLACMCFILVFAAGVPADIIYVPSGEHPTIASGLSAATAGDVVEVAAGTYYEHSLTMSSGTTLRGATGNSGDVIIDGQQQGKILECEYAESETRIEDLTVKGGLGNQGAGIGIRHSVVVVENCIIRDNESSSWGGGSRVTGDTCDVHFIGCQFLDNTTTGADGGAFSSLFGPMALEFTGCVFKGNSAADDAGALNICTADALISGCTFFANITADDGAAVVAEECDVTLDHCIMAGNLGGGAVYQWMNGSLTLSCCDIYDNVGGDWTTQVADQLGVDGNVEVDPEFCSTDGSGGNLHLQSDSPCLDCEGSPMGAYGQGCDETLVGMSSWSGLKALY